MTTTLGERVARVETRQADHEEKCLERMMEIRASIAAMRDDIKASGRTFNRTLIGVLLAILAFGAKELWVSRGGLVGAAAVASVANHDR